MADSAVVKAAIRPVISIHHNHFVMTKKKMNGGIRMNLDIIGVNKHSNLVNLKNEIIEHLFAKLNNIIYYSSIYEVSSYSLFPLNSSCQQVVAFAFEGEMIGFQFVRSGYRNDGAAWMFALQTLFGNDLLSRMMVYIGDTLIP